MMPRSRIVMPPDLCTSASVGCWQHHTTRRLHRGDLSEDRAAAFEERQAEMEALQRAVEALGEALGQAPPALSPITTARERGEGAISLIITKVGGTVCLSPAAVVSSRVVARSYSAS